MNATTVFVSIVRAIALLREEGLRYKDIDAVLGLPRYTSYRTMNRPRAKFVVTYM